MNRIVKSAAVVSLALATCFAITACAGTPEEQKAEVQAQIDQANHTLADERAKQEAVIASPTAPPEDKAKAQAQIDRITALEAKAAAFQVLADKYFANAQTGKTDPGGALTAIGDLIPGPAGLIWKLAIPVAVGVIQEIRLRNQTGGLRNALTSYVKGIDVLSSSSPELNAQLTANWPIVRSEMTPLARQIEDAHAQT